MKKIWLSALVSLIGTALSLAATASTYTDSVHKILFHSTVLNQDRGLIVHLPRGYDSTNRYPVMYVLDGGSQDQHIARTFDSLSLAGLTPEMIVVGIPNMGARNRQFQLVPPFMQTDPDSINSPMGEGDVFLRFMESELIPFIEHKYAATGMRLFAGNSRGGLLVLYSLMYKPELFQARFCFSTPVWRQDKILVTGIKKFLVSNRRLETFLYMSVGGNETENMKSGLEAMTDLLQQKKLAGFTWSTEYMPGMIHQNNAQASAASAFMKWGKFRRNNSTSSQH